MKLISHRGNIRGKKIQLENEPSYIDVALKEGYDVEIDLWIDDDGFYLGHDEPIYPIELKWLTDRYLNLWIHCKSLKTIEKLKDLEFEVGLTSLNYFWHEDDDVTITSKGHIWAYPGVQPIKYSVAVQPELNDDDTSQCIAICSDYIEKHKKLL